jgi:cysteine desulfurase / selenocysteine lyase
MLDLASRQRDFDDFDGRVYLNTAAEGIPPKIVGEALQQYFRDKQLGMDGRIPHFEQWEQAKAEAARMLGLESSEIGLCSCTSEAYNLLSLALRLRAGDEVIVNELDFPAGVTPWLQPVCPATVRVWRAHQNQLDLSDLPNLLSSKTRLVTLSLVSFYNGFTIPLEETISIIRKYSAAMIALDVTQALGRIPLNVTGIDFVVSSTHKWILSTHGGGIVAVPKSVADRIQVPAGGWLHLDDAFGMNRFEKATSKVGAQGFSVGMPNFPAVYALRSALSYMNQVGIAKLHQACWPMMERCYQGLKELPIELLTPDDRSTWAGIIAFRHLHAEQLHHALHQQNIHVMHQAGRMRVAIHGYNTMDDIERFLNAMIAELGKK